ncbi:MAG: DUF1385 domain-containing protein [Actinobacteria bacterium]|nr:DUF1385 domain-containing protein [Actinomycetota bacterium]
MARERIRLGGMALPNGVLVHGPTSWACAVRLPDGEVKVASARKRFVASGVRNPLLRGPARLLEAFSLLPELRRALPEARLPFERPQVLAAMLGSSVAVRLVRGSRLGPAAQELMSGLLSLAPAAFALRGGELAAYHGAEHVSIGSYEHDEPRAREHERCGTHLVGPILATTALGQYAASALVPPPLRAPARLAAQLGAVAVSTEIFGWMTRHPDSRLARALARPGHEFQHRLATAEPSPEQLEVAEAALAACLGLEPGGDRG